MMTLSNTIRAAESGEPAYRLPGIPAPLRYQSDWERRLDEWHALRKVPRYEELATVRAGRVGELGLRDRLGSHECSRFGEIFGGKRVRRDPRNPRAGRYEIDLILLTPRCIRAIEVKNWSGRVSLVDDRWVHQRRNGQTQVFENLVDYQHTKLQALRRYMATRGIALPPQRFESDVVFTHPRVDPDAGVADHPRVMNVAQLLQAQSKRGRVPHTTHVLSRLIEAFAQADHARKLVDGMFDIMSPGLVDAAKAAISDLRTWDQVLLHGGRRLIGDFLWLQVGGERIEPVDWPAGTDIQLAWRRGPVESLWALFGLDPLGVARGKPLSRRVVGAHDCLYFHEAGQRQPNVIALRDVDMITIG